jgi:hypothetical protein
MMGLIAPDSTMAPIRDRRGPSGRVKMGAFQQHVLRLVPVDAPGQVASRVLEKQHDLGVAVVPMHLHVYRIEALIEHSDLEVAK